MALLRSYTLSLAVLCLASIVISRRAGLCILKLSHRVPRDLGGQAGTPQWCDWPTENKTQELKNGPSTEEMVQQVLDRYKPVMAKFLPKFKLPALKFPDHREPGPKSIKEYRIKYTLSMKKLSVHEVSASSFSTLFSIKWKSLTIRMKTWVIVCDSTTADLNSAEKLLNLTERLSNSTERLVNPTESFLNSTAEHSSCYFVLNKPRIKVKKAITSLTVAWKIDEKNGTLFISPSDTIINTQHKGIKIRLGKPKIIPNSAGQTVKDRAKKDATELVNGKWALFEEPIKAWQKYGLNKTFDEDVKPNLTRSFDELLQNASLQILGS